MNPAGNAAEALALDLIGIIFVLFIQSEMNRLDAVNRSNSRQLIIVSIDDNVPVLTQMIKDLGFACKIPSRVFRFPDGTSRYL